METNVTLAEIEAALRKELEGWPVDFARHAAMRGHLAALKAERERIEAVVNNMAERARDICSTGKRLLGIEVALIPSKAGREPYLDPADVETLREIAERLYADGPGTITKENYEPALRALIAKLEAGK